MEATGEKLSTLYLMRSISMAIQKGNVVCFRGCPKKSSQGLNGLFNFHVQEAGRPKKCFRSHFYIT